MCVNVCTCVFKCVYMFVCVYWCVCLYVHFCAFVYVCVLDAQFLAYEKFVKRADVSFCVAANFLAYHYVQG